MVCVAVLAGVLALSGRDAGGDAGSGVEEQVAAGGRNDTSVGDRATGVGGGVRDDAVSPTTRRELERLATLGYIAGRSPVPDRVGVVRSDRTRQYGAYTLLSYARGTRPEAVLIDMGGRIIHSWGVATVDNLARVHLFPDGGLLALTNEPYTLSRLDRDSNVLWQYTDWPHHDFRVLPAGRIVVIIRSVTTREHIEDGSHLIDDHVVLLDAEGEELKRASLLESFERSEDWSTWLLDGRLAAAPDIFHSNSVEVVSIEPELRVLLSVRSLDALVFLNIDRGIVERVLTGSWHRQHEARLVEADILLFDNLGLGDRSRVIEVDASSGDIVWSFEADGFYSKGAGAQQRLPNGNTLITESDGGRLLEVTRSGEIVWEYVNPRRVAAEDGTVVVLGITRAVRLPAGFPVGWSRR